MATIKSFTDLGQSRKLAEILPLESADNHYWSNGYNNYICGLGNSVELKEKFEEKGLKYLPCWSLTALINIMPKDESIEFSISFGYYNGKGEYIEKWLCTFEKEGETTDDYIIETFDGDNPVDACYEMIIKLHELNLL